MSKIIHTGGGIFVDTEPVAAPDGMEDDPAVRIYAYAKFRSLEHVSYGLHRTDGGPEDDEIDSEKVGEYGMEPIAAYHQFNDALREIRKEKRKWMFDEVSYVEVTSEDDYDEAVDALDPDFIDKGDPTGWEGPGLYDFRDDPPTFQGSVEDYELDEMKDAADQAIEFMFQGEEWEDAYRELAADEEE